MKYYVPIMEPELAVSELLSMMASSVELTVRLLEPGMNYTEEVISWYKEMEEEGALPYIKMEGPLGEGDILYLPTPLGGYYKLAIK